ncbi:DUF4301 family protein [Bacteroidota bacterium]
MISEKDKQQLTSQGKDLIQVEIQIENFRKGFPFIELVKPATIRDGIISLDPASQKEFIKIYEEGRKNMDVIKFVPASGAASRMFKSLFVYLENGEVTNDIESFINNLKDFAFYDDLKAALSNSGEDIETLLDNKKYDLIIEYLLTSKGLDYGNLPKGLLKFHKYSELSRTPMEEHLVEGATYAASKENNINLHFTVSPDHQKKFRKLLSEVSEIYEREYKMSYSVDLSGQRPENDAIAVDLDNNPFYQDDGSILFRPAGHGALLANLNDLKGDIVFIKNIDNVVPDQLKPITIQFKKALAGLLLEYQGRIFEYLDILNNEEVLSPSLIEEISDFMKNELCIIAPGGEHIEAKEYFIGKLNRPLRVCGMVKNEGEPGGGPFWAVNPDGSVSLQVVESAQVDFDNSEQKEIASRATHFNPVDLVCALKNYKGEYFNLNNFVDPETGFISLKSQSGRDLKSLELPGLWNGSMSDWNTIFVEVPIETFNPVKVVNDLLRPQHQC